MALIGNMSAARRTAENLAVCNTARGGEESRAQMRSRLAADERELEEQKVLPVESALA